MRSNRYLAVIAMTVLVLGCVAQISYAQSKNTGAVFLGTWKLDTANSDFGKMPAPQSETLVIVSSTPTSEKWSMDSVDATGKATHTSFEGAVDDQHYPIKGDPEAMTFAFLKNGGWEVKDKTGRIVETGTAEVSADGKTLTFHLIRHTPDGDVNTTSVYHKAS